ncbi:MAG: hypothetical protein ABW252_17150 [Polyangiales bacterium]
MNARTVSLVVWMLVSLSGCAVDGTDVPASDSAESAVLAQAAGTWSRLPAGSLAQRAAGFTPVGEGAESAAAIASWGGGRLDLFFRGAGGSLRHLVHDDGASRWEDIGGTVQGDPAAVSSDVGRIDVFARGSDNALWQKTLEDDRWTSWRSLGGSLASGPAAASGAAGEIDVVAKSSAGGLVHRQFRDGAWGGWKRIDGNLSSDPGFDIDEHGTLHLAARAMNGTTLYRRFETGWSSWQVVPGGDTAQSAPAVAAGDGKVVGFVRGGDSAIWSITYANGRFGTNRRLGGSIVHAPKVVQGPGRIDVAVVGADKIVYHRAYVSPSNGGQADEDAGASGDVSSRDAPGI